MKTTKTFIRDRDGNPIDSSKALLWGNNAAWLCTECGELLGNRTGDTEYLVECTRPCTVGDTESGPKSDILRQASAGIRTDHCLDFPA